MNYPGLVCYILVVGLLFTWIFDNNEGRRRNITWLLVFLIAGCVMILFSCCTPTKGGQKPKQDYENLIA